MSRLRQGDELSTEFLELNHLTPEETVLLVDARVGSEQAMDWPSLDGSGELQWLAPRWLAHLVDLC